MTDQNEPPETVTPVASDALFDVSGDDLRRAMMASGKIYVCQRNCRRCGGEKGYIRRGEELFFDSECGCAGRAYLDMLFVRWDSVAEWINEMHDRKEKRRLLRGFGFSSNV